MAWSIKFFGAGAGFFIPRSVFMGVAGNFYWPSASWSVTTGGNVAHKFCKSNNYSHINCVYVIVNIYKRLIKFRKIRHISLRRGFNISRIRDELLSTKSSLFQGLIAN